MADGAYAFTGSQGAFLDALKDGRYSGSELTDYGRRRVSLRDRMPPVYQQAMRGTCVANAATALLEYYEDRKVRLSVQFLFEMTKTVERRWLDANLKALEENRDVDVEFAAKFPAQVAQVRLTTDANGKGSPAAKAFLNAFARQLGEYFNDNAGSQIKRCFEAIREYGTCRYSLWPYANMQVADPTVGGSLPPGSLEDAVKHRVLTGLYLLRSPNNVDEIRGIVAGANGRRPMPVCVVLPLFENCDGMDFRFPESVESDGRHVSRNALKGVHAMLIVGFEEDKMVSGGGWFVIRNSWGTDWGKDGYGRVPYAYVECFCTEAGTILQDMVDYAGDGYGAKTARPTAPSANLLSNGRKRAWTFVLGVLAAVGVLSAVLVTMMKWDPVPVPAVGEKPLPKSAISVEQTKAAEKEAERLKAAEESRRLAEEKRLAEARRELEAEKTKLAQERREAEERAAAKAKEERLAAEAAAREAAKKRVEAERLAAEAEKRRQAEEAEKRSTAAEAEKRRLAEEKVAAEKVRREQAERMARQQQEETARLAAERAKSKEYLVHVTLPRVDEGERDAVVRCLRELSGSISDGMTNFVENVTVVEYEAGRNIIGISKKGYQVRCDVRMVGSEGDIRRPTDEVKRILSRALNERCQPEDGDRIDWSSFTRMNCLQDFSTADGRSGARKSSSVGVRTGF